MKVATLPSACITFYCAKNGIAESIPAGDTHVCVRCPVQVDLTTGQTVDQAVLPNVYRQD